MKTPEATAKPQWEKAQAISWVLRSYWGPVWLQRSLWIKNATWMPPYSSQEAQLDGSCCHPSSGRWRRVTQLSLPDQGPWFRGSSVGDQHRGGCSLVPSTALPLHARAPQHPDRLTSASLLSAVVGYAQKSASAWVENRDFQQCLWGYFQLQQPWRALLCTLHCWDWNHSACLFLFFFPPSPLSLSFLFSSLP